MHVLGPPFQCMDKGVIIDDDSLPINMITVKGENLQLYCSVHGFVLCRFEFHSTWNISSPHFNGSVNIHDNFTNPNYYLAVYQSENLCIFINQLTIHNVSLHLNGAILTCIESIDENGSQQPVYSSHNISMSEFEMTFIDMHETA